jgi:YVTN family beta-propeller protein
MQRALPLLLVIAATSAEAQQAPFAAPDVPVSSRDRVYSADQTSNTVSVIDPSTNRTLGVIRLGDPVPGALSPLYRGQLLVHGLGYSADSRMLAVVSVGSNSVTLIDPATNRITGTIYVGRSPHEAFFTPDGRELWVTVRGENYVSIINPSTMVEVRRITLADGPGMTSFGPDGRYAFVCSSFVPELTVIDVATHTVVKRLAQLSRFCPNIAVSPENDEVWITLKDVGRVQIFDAQPPFAQKAVLETGPITNHVNFANNRNGRFAYVSIGGADVVKVYRRGPSPELVATIPVGALPHGLWPSGDGSRVYVALENGGAVQAINTLTNRVIATMPIGQTAQALVYVPNAVPSGPGTDNLVSPGVAAAAARFELWAPPGAALPAAHASVAVNSLGALDLIEIAASGLAAGAHYQVSLAANATPPFADVVPLAVLTTNPDGAGIVQALGPLKQVAPASTSGDASGPRRYLIITPVGAAATVVLTARD